MMMRSKNTGKWLALLLTGGIVIAFLFSVQNRKPAQRAEGVTGMQQELVSPVSVTDTQRIDHTGEPGKDTIWPVQEMIRIDVTKTDPETLTRFAKTLIGIPYVYASSDPNTGFDCSGL